MSGIGMCSGWDMGGMGCGRDGMWAGKDEVWAGLGVGEVRWGAVRVGMGCDELTLRPHHRADNHEYNGDQRLRV